MLAPACIALALALISALLFGFCLSARRCKLSTHLTAFFRRLQRTRRGDATYTSRARILAETTHPIANKASNAMIPCEITQ